MDLRSHVHHHINTDCDLSSIMSFANSYWSPDYKTCIGRLNEQLKLSLSQLHELRRLVFNHMKYHHSNGEFLAEFATKSYPVDSSFRASTGTRNFSLLRKVSGVASTEITMKYVFRQYVERSAAELNAQRRLAGEIDAAVLDKITAFIKHHEPQINAMVERFEDLFLEYESSYEKIEKLKLDYDSQLSFAEFQTHEKGSDVSEKTEIARSDSESKTENEDAPKDESEEIELEKPQPEESELIEKKFTESGTRGGFEFPLNMGFMNFENAEELSEFLSILTSSILVTKRKIPIPGHTNELFSSNQICKYFTDNRPRGFNPTRSNLEKLGQTLMNQRIIVSTGFFAKKFTSEGMWFEWSDEVMQALHSSDKDDETISSSSQVQSQLSKMNLDDTQKFVNEMAASTSKTFNGMFQSMKSSLIRPKYTEGTIKQIEHDYNTAYEELQRSKHLLDMEIFNKSQYLEQFEKLKIEVVYQSLTKLLEITYKHSLDSTTALHDFTLKFIEEFNKPENYKRDFTNTLARFSTGIYFPSFIAPDYLTQKHINISQLNTNFQNIKLGFNLYKDVPLQLKMSDKVPHDSSIALTVRSVPVLLYEMINYLNEQGSQTCSHWLEPIRHQDYWLVKYEIVNAVQDFVPEGNVNLHDHNAVETAIFARIIFILKEKEATRLINFLKNWLLETSDSVIPSTVYDSLVGAYFKENGTPAKDTVRILKTIPRSNLGSLLYILDHIAKMFDLDSTEKTGDEPNDSEEHSDKLHSTCEKLNTMDAVGAIPFTHLILRPSVSKHATGFKPPLRAYNALLADILSSEVRAQLTSALGENETRFMEKQQQQVKNLGLAKKPLPPIKQKIDDKPEVEITCVTPTTPTKIASVAPIRSLNLGDNFSLRPFRTGTTPRPSPSSSPVHKRKISDEQGMPKSTSTNFLAPINIQFEGQPKSELNC